MATWIQDLAQKAQKAVSVTFDPTAEVPEERWIVEIGLDLIGAGETPQRALANAAHDLVRTGASQN